MWIFTGGALSLLSIHPDLVFSFYPRIHCCNTHYVASMIMLWVFFLLFWKKWIFSGLVNCLELFWDVGHPFLREAPPAQNRRRDRKARMMQRLRFSIASSFLGRILGPQTTLNPECRQDISMFIRFRVILPLRLYYSQFKIWHPFNTQIISTYSVKQKRDHCYPVCANYWPDIW